MDHGDFFMKRNNYSRKTLTLARKLVRMHKEATDHWNAGNETGASTAYHDPRFC